jgi:hypothetical protein
MRKSLKKVCVSIISSVLAVSAMPITLGAVAAENDNILSVSTQVLTNGTVVDDTVIPAGSVAISVSISNNAGFRAYSTKLELGSAYDIIVDENNYPVVDAGSAIGDSRIGSSRNDNIAVVSTASANENREDGEMFTIYATKDNTNMNTFISVCEFDEDVDSPSYYIGNYNCFKIGDVDDDRHINALDATCVLDALNETGSNITFASASDVTWLYFPDIADVRAAFIYTLPSSNPYNPAPITSGTADEILTYYSCQGTHQPYTGPSYLGQVFQCANQS